jgi:hypothetical protein
MLQLSHKATWALIAPCVNEARAMFILPKFQKKKKRKKKEEE